MDFEAKDVSLVDGASVVELFNTGERLVDTDLVSDTLIEGEIFDNVEQKMDTSGTLNLQDVCSSCSLIVELSDTVIDCETCPNTFHASESCVTLPMKIIDCLLQYKNSGLFYKCVKCREENKKLATISSSLKDCEHENNVKQDCSNASKISDNECDAEILFNGNDQNIYPIPLEFLEKMETMSAESAKTMCKNFLATLLHLANEKHSKVAQNVRTLLQGLIDGKVEPEVFTEAIQKDLNSSPQPYLVPFLKMSLPYLRTSLAKKELSIDSVIPPALSSVQPMPPPILSVQPMPPPLSSVQPMPPPISSVQPMAGFPTAIPTLIVKNENRKIRKNAQNFRQPRRIMKKISNPESIQSNLNAYMSLMPAIQRQKISPRKITKCQKSSFGIIAKNQKPSVTKNKVYSCESCNYTTLNCYHFKAHRNTHVSLKCETCGMEFKLKVSLEKHKRIVHTGEKVFDCVACSRSFLSESALEKHKEMHTKERLFKCNTCDSAFTTKSTLNVHLNTVHTDQIFLCDICNKAFKRKDTLTAHLRIHSGEKFACHLCDRTYTKAVALRTHLLVHSEEKPYKCDQCEFSTKYHTNLTHHRKTHTDVKPYKCSFCDYSCREKFTITVHMRTHTGEKPFKCHMCDYAAISNNNLIIHTRNSHEVVKRFKCDYCNYSNHTKHSVDKHVRIHTGEKPFSCNLCSYAATDGKHLRVHLRTHTGEKPYACELCDYSASQKGSLKLHMKKHETLS